MSAVAIAVDAATDAAARRIDDADLAYAARFDRVTAETRMRVHKATGADLSLMLVEHLSADQYARTIDALVERARDLAHAPIRSMEAPAIVVASAWDVAEDALVTALVAKEMQP